MTRIAWIRENALSSYTPNARRMSEFIGLASDGTVSTDFIYRANLSAANWDEYDGVVNTSYLSPEELALAGLDGSKILNPGSYSMLENKGAFALLSDEKLRSFWEENLGREAFERLREFFIPTILVASPEDLKAVQQADGVVKVFAADGQPELLDSGKGVFGPWSDYMQWRQCSDLLNSGVRFIGQPFVTPKQFTAFLRAKGGRNLEKAEGVYNRICVKFVAMGDPNDVSTEVALTAAEATLGEGKKPIGKDSCFTAVAFR